MMVCVLYIVAATKNVHQQTCIVINLMVHVVLVAAQTTIVHQVSNVILTVRVANIVLSF